MSREERMPYQPLNEEQHRKVEEIMREINQEFDKAKVGNRSDLLTYFVENKLTKLIDNLGDF